MLSIFHSVLDDRRGVTAIEYALVALFIAVAIVIAVGTVGSSVSSTFTTVAGSF